jgi:hypothetical protein
MLNGGAFDFSRSFQFFLGLVRFREKLYLFVSGFHRKCPYKKEGPWVVQLRMHIRTLVVLLLLGPQELSNCWFQVLDLLSCNGRNETDVSSEIAMGVQGYNRTYMNPFRALSTVVLYSMMQITAFQIQIHGWALVDDHVYTPRLANDNLKSTVCITSITKL